MRNTTFNSIVVTLFVAGILSTFGKKGQGPQGDKVLVFRNATIIDGKGGSPLEHTDLRVEGNTITAIGKSLDTNLAVVIDATHKTIMPALSSTHVHVGTLKGTKTAVLNYTRENILSQLSKYQDYGVLNVLSMGTDRPLLFEKGFYDSLKQGMLEGARMHSAGVGFGVPQGAPAPGGIMDLLYRPVSVAQVAAQMDSLAKLKPDVVKVWVDDFGGQYKKMAPAIYTAIIQEAHKHKLRVVAHVWYLADARNLIAAGVDILGHSIRDSVVDEQLIHQMQEKKVVYIPTLTLDEFAFIYALDPEWINDPFFKASLEPGVYPMITAAGYRDSLKGSPGYARSLAGFKVALINVAKLYKAGILISHGTDSGAMPLRAQGFAEHLEMELLVQAGLKPLEAITIATKNAAEVLRIDDRYGTLEKGKIADLLILSANPAQNIINSRKIEAVYRSGKLVSKGPLN